MIHRSTLLFLALLACGGSTGSAADVDDQVYEAGPLQEGQADIILAGGCFWCMESSFEALPGVIAVDSGYSGGPTKPSYKEVGSGTTGHIEVVRVIYDAAETTHDKMLEAFWYNIDPTQANGQFCDRGPQYRSAVFVADAEERKKAEATRKKAAEILGKEVVTEILDDTTFWVAEEYHQDFYKKNPSHYKRYRLGCGRDRRLKALWGEAAGH